MSAVGKDKLDAAVKKVKEIAFDPEIGHIFDGNVVKILDAGAFVNYLGNRDGFVHISEISHERVESVASVLSEGQKVRVKLVGFERGKAKLTIKNVDAETIDSGPSKKERHTKEAKDNKGEKKPEKRESSKKWKDNNNAKDEDIKERKYFN